MSGRDMVRAALLGGLLAAAGGAGFAGALPADAVARPVATGAAVGAVAAVVPGARVRAGVVVLVVSVVAGAVVAVGSGPASLWDAWGPAGWVAIRDAHAPAPPTPAALAVPYLATAGAAFLGATTLRRAGWGLTAAAPSLAAMVLGFALASSWSEAPPGVPVAWAALALLASPALGTASAGPPAPPGPSRASGAARALGAGAVVTVAVLAAVPLAGLVPTAAERWVLPPAPGLQPSVVGQHPLATVVALRNGRDEVLFEVETSAPVARWRLTALDRYDGETWSGSHRFRTVSAELPRVGPPDRPRGDRVSQAVELMPAATGDGDIPVWGPWLPAADGLVATSIDGLLFDLGTSTLAPAAAAPHRYEVTSLVHDAGEAGRGSAPATDRDADSIRAAPPGADDLVAELTALADEITATAPSGYGRAVLIQRHLLTGGELAVGDDAPGGHTLRHIRDFLLSGEGLYGTAEQYATAFVVLARAVGLPARLVVGFEGSAAPGRQQVSSHQATAWAEVRFEDAGWVPFDAVPSRTAEVLPPEPAAPTTAPSPDDVAPDREATGDAGGDRPADGASRRQAGGGSARSPLVTGLGVAGGIALALAAIGPGARRAWRRRGWRRRPTPAGRVAGAWSWFLDDLRRAGVRVGDSVAGTAVARQAAGHVPPVADEIVALGALANRAAFDREPPTEADERRAWQLARTVVRARHRRRGTGRRLRELWVW